MIITFIGLLIGLSYVIALAFAGNAQAADAVIAGLKPLHWTEPGNESSYNKPELREEFIQDVRAIVRGFTPGHEDAIIPVANYREFFNIYALWWPSTPPWNPDVYYPSD